MRSFILTLLFCIPLIVLSQHKLIPYPEVVRSFYREYSFEKQDPFDGLEFAKKKDGWYVRVVDLRTEKPLREALYWSSATGHYLPLNGFSPPLDQEQAVKEVEKRFGYGFYAYERSPYFGYAGWDYDVIMDYGSIPLLQLNDTTLDALGRAYSAFASRFFWFQYGGITDTDDSLQISLKPGQLPSPRRVDSAEYYIKKAITCYDLLSRKNNSYPTIVGNAGMKAFNEKLHGFMQMKMANRNDKAQQFLKSIQPNEMLTRIAKNHLQTLPPKSILFTFGDNDTYPLWYVQESEHYRKDVAVINLNLLGFAPYVQQLKREGTVNFSTKTSHYTHPGFLYSLFKGTEERTGDSIAPLGRFIVNLQKQIERNEPEEIDPPTYEVKQVQMNVDLSRFKSMGSQPYFSKQLHFVISDYLVMDYFLMLDIVHTNFYNRPIYFSSLPELLGDYVQTEGIIHRLFPLDVTKKEITKAIGVRNLETYVVRNYKNLSSADLRSGIAPSKEMDGGTYSLYLEIINDYVERGETKKATEWIEKLEEIYKGQFVFSYQLYSLGMAMIKAGQQDKGIQLLEKHFADLYNNYLYPTASDGYVNKGYLQSIVLNAREIMNLYKINNPSIDKQLKKLEEVK